MTNNDESYSESSARPHLTVISRVQMFFSGLSRKFEDLAYAMDDCDDELLDDRIAALEQRIALLEAQKVLSRQN